MFSTNAWGQTTVKKTSFTSTSGKLDDNVSYTTAKGGGTTAPAINNNEIRLYQNSAGTGGGTITIKVASEYKISSVTIGSSQDTKIAYTLDESDTKSTTESLSSKDKYKVSGIDASSITFYCMGTTQSSRLYVNYLEVTYIESGKKSANLKFEQDTYTVNVGKTLQVKATSDNTDAKITYSIVEPSCGCSINANGLITAGSSTATVTIKATTEDDGTYAKGEATCTLKVIDPNATTVTDELTAADFTATTANYKSFSNVTKESGVVYAGSTATASDAIQINTTNGIIVTANKDGYTLKSISVEWNSTTSNERPLNIYGKNEAYTSYTDLTSETKQGTKLGSIVYGNGKPTSLDIEGQYTYIGLTCGKNALYINKITLVWVKSSTPTGQFTIGEEGYATYYTENAYIMPADVEGGIITGVNGLTQDAGATSTVAVTYSYPAGATVPAGTPLLLHGPEGTYTYDITTSEETAPEGNLLHGADAVNANGQTYVAPTNNGTVRYYILSHSKDGKKFGFYYAATNGAAVTYQEPYAFLAYEFVGTQSAIGFSLDGDNTSGISATVSGKAAKGNGRVYSVTGVCVGDSLNNLPAGIYIMNGKKIAVK